MSTHQSAAQCLLLGFPLGDASDHLDTDDNDVALVRDGRIAVLHTLLTAQS